MVTVTGTFLKPDDTPCTGAVTFAVYVAASDTTPDNRVVTPAPVVVRLDDTGSFTVDLVASDDDGWQTDGPMPYTIGINVTGQRAYNYAAYINDPGPYDIGDLVVLDWPPNVANIPGLPGPEGDAATVDVGTTTTGAAGTDAAVVNSGSTSAAVFDFTIPKGDKGDPGDSGGELSDADPLPVGDTNDPGTDLLGSRADHTHAGTRITRPNVDDRLVEQWNGSAWSVVDYDSGWRNVLNDATATGGTVTVFKVRRQNSRVLVDVSFSDKTAAGNASWSAPAGFRSPSGHNYAQLTSRSTGTGDLYSLSSTTWQPYTIQFSWNAGGYPNGGGLFTGGLTHDTIPTSLPGTLDTSAPQ